MVSEVEAVPLPPGGPANPHGNGFRLMETELTRVAVAGRNHNFNTARHWWGRGAAGGRGRRLHACMPAYARACVCSRIRTGYGGK